MSSAHRFQKCVVFRVLSFGLDSFSSDCPVRAVSDDHVTHEPFAGSGGDFLRELFDHRKSQSSQGCGVELQFYFPQSASPLDAFDAGDEIVCAGCDSRVVCERVALHLVGFAPDDHARPT